MTYYAHPAGPRDYIEMGHGAPEPEGADCERPPAETPNRRRSQATPNNKETTMPTPLPGNPYAAPDSEPNAILALAYETRRQTDVLEKRARLAALTAADRGIRLPDDLYELIEEER